MRKITTGFAISSTVMMALAILLQIVLLTGNILFAYRFDLLDVLSPVVSILFNGVMLCCMGAMIFLANRKKGGIWIEIILLPVMIVTLPVASTVIQIIVSIVFAYLPYGGLYNGVLSDALPWSWWEIYEWINITRNLMYAAARLLFAATLGMSIAIRFHDKRKSVSADRAEG